jgi:hypothetical protein
VSPFLINRQAACPPISTDKKKPTWGEVGIKALAIQALEEDD